MMGEPRRPMVEVAGRSYILYKRYIRSVDAPAYIVKPAHEAALREVARLQEENKSLRRRVEDAEAYRDLVKGRVPAMEEVERLQQENAALREQLARDADNRAGVGSQAYCGAGQCLCGGCA